MEKDPKGRVALWLAYLIMASWVVAFARTQFDSKYEIPAGITPLMLSVAGWCFVAETVGKIRRVTPDEAANEDTTT